MNKIFFTLLSISFILISLEARGTTSLPVVSEFLVEEVTVYEHLSSMLESAMQYAVEHEDINQIHTDESTRKIVLTKAMTGFLNFDVKTLDAELVNSDPDVFVKNVINLFNESSVVGLSIDVSTVESSRPNEKETTDKLRMIMMGYYFAIMQENKFDDSNLKVDWKFQIIQQQMHSLMTQKMNELAQKFQTMMFQELSERAKRFNASFQISHKQIVYILKSFKAYATEILIDQLRTFYFNLTQDNQAVEMSKAKDVFKRTIDMWMVAYKLCERDCQPKHFASLIPNFLEDLIITRIQENKNIVSSPLVKTFFSKFLAYLFQQNFQNNISQNDNDELMDLNERYAMFVYRLFFSKQSRKMNEHLSKFLTDVYASQGLNYLYPEESLKNTDNQEFMKRQTMNQKYIIDLILHLDFPEINEEIEHTADMERQQKISFSEDDILTLVEAAATWFAYDLDTLTGEELTLNWFVDYDKPSQFKDYLVMYETLLQFKTQSLDENQGESLDMWLNEYLVLDVEDLPKDNELKQERLSLFWIMKTINMINVLSGDFYDLEFNNNFKPETIDDIITYFRRITMRDEFSFLKKAMLQIYAYYKDDDVYSTDLENDKFLYDTYNMSIECEKLPEILGTEVTTINVTFKDDEDTMDFNRKKNLDNGTSMTDDDFNRSDSQKSTNEIVEISSENSNDSSENTKAQLPVVINKTDNKTPVHKDSESSDINIAPLFDEVKSNKSINSNSQNNEKTKKLSHENVDLTSENSSSIDDSIEQDIEDNSIVKDVEDKSESSTIPKKVIQSNKSSEINVDVSSENSETIDNISKPQVISKKSSEVIVDVSSENSDSDLNNRSKSIVVISNKSSELNVDKSSENTEKVKDNRPTIIEINKSSQQNIDLSSENSDSIDENNKIPIVVKTSDKTSNENLDVSSENSKSNINERSTKDIVKTSNKSSEINVEVSSENSDDNTSKVIDSSHKNIDLSSNSSSHVNNLDEVDNKSQKSNKNKSMDSVNNKSKNKSEITYYEPIVKDDIEDKSQKSNKSTSEKSDVIDISQNNSHSGELPVNTNNKTSKSNDSSENIISVNSDSIKNIQEEIEEQIIIDSSSNSSDIDEDSQTTDNKSDVSDEKSNKSDVSQEKSNKSDVSQEKSNKSDTNNKDYVVLPIINPVTPDDNSPIVVESQEETIENKRHNLVYEVKGRLTPQQMKTFEFSDDVFASIKDLKLQVDEYGNETEFVYVQIVRKDSDCYEELLKFK